MRRILPLALSTLLLVGSAAAQQRASRSYNFVNSIGVNTHFTYTDTAYYQQPATLIQAIQNLHVRHVRDGLAYSWVAPNLYTIHAQLAQAGILADLVTPNPQSGATAAQLDALLPNYPDVEAIEGPNEYDQTNNANWAADLKAYLPTVWQAGDNAHLTVIGPSFTQPASYSAIGVISGYMNFNNLHAYWGGRNPETWGWGGLDAQGHAYGSFEYDLDKENIDGPGVPVIMTESGYVANHTPVQGEIWEGTEAVYAPRLLLHAWNKGITRTYLYELMDDPSSTTGYGLLRYDLSPRPAYIAIANLTKLLADGSGTFAPETLDYSLTGNTTGVETTLLEKQDGSFWLAIWLKGSIYDVNALKPTPIGPQAVQISVSGGKNVHGIWSFDQSGNTSSTSVNSATVNLSVSSTIQLLKIS